MFLNVAMSVIVIEKVNFVTVLSMLFSNIYVFLLYLCMFSYCIFVAVLYSCYFVFTFMVVLLNCLNYLIIVMFWGLPCASTKSLGMVLKAAGRMVINVYEHCFGV